MTKIIGNNIGFIETSKNIFMEKPNRIAAQVYGYAVCLVAVITFIFATITFINSIVDMGDLSHSAFSNSSAPSLASFENYKMDILKTVQKTDDASASKLIPDEATLKAMYQAAKDEKIQSARHSTKKSLLISSTILLISVVLFFTHWRWVRNTNKDSV